MVPTNTVVTHRTGALTAVQLHHLGERGMEGTIIIKKLMKPNTLIDSANNNNTIIIRIIKVIIMIIPYMIK